MPSTREVTSIDRFHDLEIRSGRVVAVDDFPEARKPAFKLTIDFGQPVGTLRSSAQLTRRYSRDDLLGSSILALVNLPSRRIAGFSSECLVLGVVNPDDPADVVLVRPDRPMTEGWELG